MRPLKRGRGLPGFALGHLVQGGGRKEPARRVPGRAHLHQRARALESLVQEDRLKQRDRGHGRHRWSRSD